MTRSRLLAPLLGLAVALLSAAPALAQAPAPAARTRHPAKKAEVSDVLKTPRPPGGEWFGLYLMDKKVGYFFTDLSLVPGRTDQVCASTSWSSRPRWAAGSPSACTARSASTRRSPGAGCCPSWCSSEGDGGDQRLEGTQTPAGLRVVRKRPGLPDEALTLPASPETVEDADQARVAISARRRWRGPSRMGRTWRATRSPPRVSRPRSGWCAG